MYEDTFMHTEPYVYVLQEGLFLTSNLKDQEHGYTIIENFHYSH